MKTMGPMIELRGMTWDHERGHAPLVAASAAFSRIEPGVSIRWDRRSLQDFEHFPVDVLARSYDLIVMDHPHVGQLADGGALLPLETFDRTAVKALEAASVGASFRSYLWGGHLWALPIDAAAQVQAYRPDRVDGPAKNWDTVMKLAEGGEVLCPLRAPHALMCFFTLAANAGTPCATTSGPLLPGDNALMTLERLKSIAAAVDPQCRQLDPIEALDLLAGDDRFTLAPLVYGYVPYAQPGFRSKTLRFADIPALGPVGCAGSALGGTGLAVSAATEAPNAARRFAFFVTSQEVQKGLYASSSGQPGHRAAWLDARVNDASGNFYRDTLATLDGAWLRPRHAGYVAFQASASLVIEDFLDGVIGASEAFRRLDAGFRRSFCP